MQLASKVTSVSIFVTSFLQNEELIMSLVMSNNEQESDESGQEDSCDNVIETQGPSRYEQKESRKNASK
jgi:hypothetical protein